MEKLPLAEAKREKTVRNIVFALLLCCALALSVVIGLTERLDVSFNAVNGDWQHYNMFRRVLAGQAPYRDFALVLGLGVIFGNSALLAVIGNTFANSVLSVHLLLALVGFIIVFTYVFIFFKNKLAAAAVSLSVMVFSLCYDAISTIGIVEKLPFIKNLLSSLKELLSGVSSLFVPDNASRPMRFCIVFIVILVLLLINKYRGKKLIAKLFSLPEALKCAVFGAFAGLIILWANDYGSSAYVGISFAFFLWYLKDKKFWKLVSNCLIYIAASLLSLFVAVLLVTKGSVGAWFKQTFATTDYLWWFDGIMYERKPFTISQYPPFNGVHAFEFLLTIAAMIVIIIFFFKAKQKSVYAITHIFLIFTATFYLYLNCYEYGFEREYMNPYIQYSLMLVCYALFCFFKLVLEKLKARRPTQKVKRTKMAGLIISSLALLVCAVFTIKMFSWYYPNRNNKERYIDSLGGNVYAFYDDLLMTEKKLEGHTLFSTYASALEAMRGEFQPTKYDYILHVFGDEGRAEYVREFHEFDPDYVSIISRDYTRWEAWICNQNWFFYRELAPNYSYEFSNAYARYLVKNTEGNAVDTEYNVTVEKLDDASVIITVKTDETDKRLISDICLSWSSSFTEERWKQGAIRKIVSVEGTDEYLYPSENFDCWFIPSESECWYIPIMIENGIGEVTIKTTPSSCTTLDNVSAKVEGVYDADKFLGEWE